MPQVPARAAPKELHALREVWLLSQSRLPTFHVSSIAAAMPMTVNPNRYEPLFGLGRSHTLVALVVMCCEHAMGGGW